MGSGPDAESVPVNAHQAPPPRFKTTLFEENCLTAAAAGGSLAVLRTECRVVSSSSLCKKHILLI